MGSYIWATIRAMAVIAVVTGIYCGIAEAVEIEISSSKMEVVDSKTMLIKNIRTMGDTFQATWSWDSKTNGWVLKGYEPQPWKSLADLPTGGYWGAAAVWNNMLYVIGGGGGRYSAIEAYDPALDAWVVKKNYSVGFLVRAVTVGNVIYVLGDSGEFWKYTPADDGWQTLAKAPTPKWVSELAEVNGKIYVFGGYDGTGLNYVWEYNPTSGAWTKKADMPTARYGSATAVMNNKIYVFGGGYGSSSNEVYDPATNSWGIRSEMPFSLLGWDVAAPSGNKIVLVEAEGSGRTAIYDPTTDAYEWGDEMTIPRGDYMMGDGINGTIGVAGGYDAPKALQAYKPVAQAANKAVLSQQERASATATMEEAYVRKHKRMEEDLANRRNLQSKSTGTP